MKCKKCGEFSFARKVYDKTTDTIRRGCSACGYEWRELPDDRKETPIRDLFAALGWVGDKR